MKVRPLVFPLFIAKKNLKGLGVGAWGGGKGPRPLAPSPKQTCHMFEFHLKNSFGPGWTPPGGDHTARGVVETPVFMPVATYGTVKTLTPEELGDLGAGIILSNMYHLYLQARGGGHRRNWGACTASCTGTAPSSPTPAASRSSAWRRSAPSSEEGVMFRSHLDGSSHFLTPEKVVALQEALGVDIMICLDECPGYPAPEAEVRRAVARTLAWAKRSRAARTRHGGGPVPRGPGRHAAGVAPGAGPGHAAARF